MVRARPRRRSQPTGRRGAIATYQPGPRQSAGAKAPDASFPWRAASSAGPWAAGVADGDECALSAPPVPALPAGSPAGPLQMCREPTHRLHRARVGVHDLTLRGRRVAGKGVGRQTWLAVRPRVYARGRVWLVSRPPVLSAWQPGPPLCRPNIQHDEPPVSPSGMPAHW